MRSPEDFPADIIAAADAAIDRGYNEGLVESVCRALMERDRAATERAAKIAEGFDAWPQEGADIAAAIRSQPWR
jgi:hypothetical protein